MKLHQSFVRDLSVDAADTSIVTAMIGMGHNFNLQVVTEGVETADQLIFIRQHGCHAAQGHYFSAPLPAAECTTLLQHGWPI